VQLALREQFPLPRNTEIFAPTFAALGSVRYDDVTAQPHFGRNEPYHRMPPGHLPVHSYLAIPVVARVGDVLRDLSYVVADGDVLEAVPVDSEEGRSVLRHSTAHVLAQAVQQLFPEAKLGIGPPIQDGFYYEFEFSSPIHEDDLATIERELSRLLEEGRSWSREEVTADAAVARFEGEHQPYKVELVGTGGGDMPP